MSEDKKDHTVTVEILTLIDEVPAQKKNTAEVGFDPYNKAPSAENNQSSDKD